MKRADFGDVSNLVNGFLQMDAFIAGQQELTPRAIDGI
jgi:hypothetical protein